ncbi:SusC/RagA family TonB-linked outer membrane protein [Pinibacter aurantiacus]|uniref:TonB-dependent receptor n=1 Tax=Pinibacter aurantiacus TaxID=2851599 RepID=A0A9E2W577_9BACT|nr:TonB-dependent receptor [Pinibacter aurantiacus]MBV4360570.1 TonB-dependent receptor [Pinibacter aurantiacus]
MIVCFINSKKRLSIWMLTMLCLLTITAHSQQGNSLRGQVKDEHDNPIAGASIVAKNDKTSFSAGAQSDTSGIFQFLKLPAGGPYSFTVSAIGYETQTLSGYIIQQDGKMSLLVKLVSKATALEQIVVVGYGTQKKVDLTGAVAVVDKADIVNKPVPNVMASMQGLLPGVMITRTNGKPGDEGYDIRIRGFSSANDTKALILVDGMEMDMNLLNPDDIESISILKDAAAASIYGARAAAGVVLVTTKKGTGGRTNINFNSYYGLNITARQPQRLSSWDEQTLINESRVNSGAAPEFTDEQIQWLKNPNFDYRPNMSNNPTGSPNALRWDYYDNINWVKEGMKQTSSMQNYSLSISGGKKELNYLLSGGYYTREGVIKYGPDQNDRYNLRLNVNGQLNKYMDLSVSASYAGSFVAENSYGVGNVIERLYRIRTRQPIYVPAEDKTGSIYNGDLQVNPIDLEKNSGVTNKNYQAFTGQGNLTIKNLAKGLTINVIGSRLMDNYDYRSEKRSLYWYGMTTSNVRFNANVPNSLAKTKNNGWHNNLQAFATYTANIKNEHHFKLMGGYSYEEYRKDEMSAGANTMPTNDFYSLNYGDLTTKTNGDLVETWAMESYFGRFNYDFRDKYLFEANLRYDGSTRLDPSNRWGAFPSFSAGWKISNENFMRNVSFIDNLKLRASWGQLGNGAVLGLYDYVALLNSGTSLSFNDQKTPYYYQSTMPSKNKTWEIVQTSDIGLDVAFLRNRLSVTADYYTKRNKNMLATLQLPSLIGVDVSSSNVGELKSWGWEFDIRWKDQFRNGSYSIGVNIADNQNELVKYDGKNSIGNGGLVNLLQGYALNTIWGYKTDGYFQQPEDYAKYGITKTGQPANIGPGDVKYLDLNGDKVVNAGGGTPQNPGDLVYLGNTNARYTFGFNLGATWKNFDFSCFFQGVGKRNFLIEANTLNPLNASSNMPWTIMMDRWTPDNRNALFPRTYASNNFNFDPSDKWVQNGSYIRLKNIQVGYNVPIKRKFFQSIRAYVSGQDLWEYTKVLNVFDPEVGNNVNANTYPFYRVVSFGLNAGF